jgi:hypothetical protein
MSVSENMKQMGRSWNVRIGGLCAKRPRLMGNRNLAVLRCNIENTLSLEATYDPPGNMWLMLILVAAALAGVAVAVSMKVPITTIGSVGAGSIGALYFPILFWRKRKTTLDMNVSTDAVVDQKHSRMAFLVPLENGTYWIVLEFADGFVEAVNAVRQAMGPRLRTSQIGRISMGLVGLLLAIVLLFVLAFGYFMIVGCTASAR